VLDGATGTGPRCSGHDPSTGDPWPVLLHSGSRPHG